MSSPPSPSESIQRELEQLDFHDSVFSSIQLGFSDGNARNCRIHLYYYDWEGNSLRRRTDSNSPWTARSLTIAFDYLAHFEYSAPDLLNRAQDIDRIEFGSLLENLRASEAGVRSMFPGYKSPLFDSPTGPLSLKFITQNCADNNEGYVLVIGSQCRLTWDARPALVGQAHIPVAE
jgi:hypothetical protein